MVCSLAKMIPSRKGKGSGIEQISIQFRLQCSLSVAMDTSLNLALPPFPSSGKWDHDTFLSAVKSQ